MVAQHTSNPGPPPRSLSPEVEDRLARALATVLSGKAPTIDGDLKRALEAAAHEARDRALLPEELVLAFKRLELRVDAHPPQDETARVALRTRVIRSLLEAYYRG